MMKIKLHRQCLLAALLLIAGILGLTACSAEPQNVETKGYDTPEKAAAAYLEGFKKKDLQQMEGAFAIESYVNHYDFDGNLERLGAYIYVQEIKLPDVNQLTRDLNIENRRASVANSILQQYVTLASLDFEIVEPQILKDERAVELFTEGFSKGLKSVETETIKLIGFIPPDKLSDIYSTDDNQKNLKTLADICGADKIESSAAVFELSGKPYLLCLDVVNYGGKWFVYRLNGNVGVLMGLSVSTSGIVPVTDDLLDEEWESLVAPFS